MKTLLNIIAFLTWAILVTIAFCNPEKLAWKIALTGILLFIGWMAYEIRHAKQMPEDFE